MVAWLVGIIEIMDHKIQKQELTVVCVCVSYKRKRKKAKVRGTVFNVYLVKHISGIVQCISGVFLLAY